MKDEYWQSAKEQIDEILSYNDPVVRYRVSEVFTNLERLNAMHKAKGRDTDD